MNSNIGQVLQWEASTDNFATVANTTVIPGTAGNSFLNGTPLTQTTCYRARVQNGVCADATSPSTCVTVDPLTDSGTLTSDATVCANTNTHTMNLSAFEGDILRWEATTSTFTPGNIIVINNQTPSLTVNNLTQTTRYRVVVQSGVCNVEFSNEVEVQVDPVTIAGTLTSDATTCTGANSTTLNLAGFNGLVLRWETSVNNFAAGFPVNTLPGPPAKTAIRYQPDANHAGARGRAERRLSRRQL